MPETKKKKPVPKTHGRTIACSQQDAIDHLVESNNKLSIIITGNGDPSKGLSAKVAVIEMHVSRLEAIEKKLDTYHGQVEEYKAASQRVSSAFEQYRASIQGEARGESKVSTRNQVNFNNAISIISAILILVGIIATYLTSKKDNQALDDKINNLGTPVIINSRGLPSRLPPGDSLKFFRDGEFKSTLKDSQEAKK